MKKLIVLAIGVALLSLTGCKEDQRQPNLVSAQQNDSLQRLLAQKDNEINDMMETFNQIEEGLRQITEAENRLNVVRNGEGADKRQQIVENIQFISTTMKQNRELVARLRQQLRESSVKGEEMRKTLENLVKQLDEKEQQLQTLRTQLNEKDIHIAELDETINELNNDVADLRTESSQKTETINAQDKQLNTAWYVFGTKKELREQNIIDGDRVLESNFNKSYFTKIDIRVQKEVKLYAKSARLLTTHPSSSYTLERDANKQYTLRITNSQLFWSTSKYLVILVK